MCVESYVANHPTWTRQDAMSRVVGLHMAQKELPKRVFEVRRDLAEAPENVMVVPAIVSTHQTAHLFGAMPAHVEMTVLVAEQCQSTGDGARSSTDTKVITVKGSSHWIQHENPDVIVRMAVDEVERLHVAEQS